MARLLMISGDRSAALGKQGAFYNTLEEFHKYWERIDIICPKTTYNLQLITNNLFGNVFIHPSPWPLIFQPWWILKKGQEIYREQRFDLITVHEYPPFYNGFGAMMLWNKINPVKSSLPLLNSSEDLTGRAGVAEQQFNRVKVPYVLEIFHIPGYPKAANLKGKIYRLFFYFFIKYDVKKAKAVRVMNNQVAEKLANLGIMESKVNLIPAIYIDLDIFKPMDLEKKYDLIFIGRLEKNKGLMLLLDAIKTLVFKFNLHSLKVMIVGDGSERNKLEARSRGLEIEDNIVFRGWAEDSKEVARLINESRVLVMTSYNEGGPRVILEAIACGVPILATPVGIVADIIKDGHFGRIISWDSEDIAQKVNSLLSDESEYQKYKEATIEMATRFEKKSAIKNYAEKLKKLI